MHDKSDNEYQHTFDVEDRRVRMNRFSTLKTIDTTIEEAAELINLDVSEIEWASRSLDDATRKIGSSGSPMRPTASNSPLLKRQPKHDPRARTGHRNSLNAARLRATCV